MMNFVTLPEEKWKMLRHKKDWIKEIEDATKTKIDLSNTQEVKIEGTDPILVLKAKQIIQALGRGFDFQSALNLLDEDYFLDVINLNDYAKSKNRQIQLKARVIGSQGIVKKKIENDTETKIALYGKTISIIGKWRNVQIARQAIEMLLNGAMHDTVYRFLERQKHE